MSEKLIVIVSSGPRDEGGSIGFPVEGVEIDLACASLGIPAWDAQGTRDLMGLVGDLVD